MAFYIRTYELTKALLSFEKDHLDVISVDINELHDPGEDPSTSLIITGVNSASPEFAEDEWLDSDESLSKFF